jgi:alkylation response protein AidB-like acyl-CoA dehydrogenase
MDFDFSEAESEFLERVKRFIAEHRDPEVMDVTRENMAQISDTPKRRAFMREVAAQGWLGITWPKEHGGQEGSGVYEYLLNEALAEVGAPQIGKGVGIIGKTLIRHGSEKLKREFLPKILSAEIEFAVGYSEPQAGSDAASMQLEALRDGDGWRLSGQKMWTTSAHFADWYWVGARTKKEDKHGGITLFLIPMNHPGIEVQEIPTIGDERTNAVYFNDVWVSDEYRVGQLNRGFQYISEALDLERFTMFTYAPIRARIELLVDYVRGETQDGKPLRGDPIVRQKIAQLVTQGEVARCLGLKFVAASSASAGGKPPTIEASMYKLFATSLSQRVANASMDLGGPGSQLRVHTEDAPMRGRAESTYRYTVIDTVGGGGSEIQKNIIARRGLGLPKNF